MAGIAFSLVFVLAGAGLLLDFFLWNVKGGAAAGTIARFENKKPVMSFIAADGAAVTRRAECVTHIGYLLGRPKEGDIFNVSCRGEGDAARVRVSGCLHLLAGALLFFPAAMALALEFGRLAAFQTASFALVFAALLGGGWAAMKWIRRNY